MADKPTQLVHVDVAGQDDNLGDSVLRRGYLDALRGPRRRFRLTGHSQTADYIAGLALTDADEWFSNRNEWLESPGSMSPPVQAVNAGEINPTGVTYPTNGRAQELAAARIASGVVLRFDRPYPSASWMAAVRCPAKQTSTQIVEALRWFVTRLDRFAPPWIWEATGQRYTRVLRGVVNETCTIIEAVRTPGEAALRIKI